MGQSWLYCWDKMLSQVKQVVLVCRIILFTMLAMICWFTRGPSECHSKEFLQGYGETEPTQTHHVLSCKSTLGYPHIFVLSKLLFELRCLLSRSSMTPHSSHSRRPWTCTTAFFPRTLPVNSLSSTRSLMGNDILSLPLHALLLFAYLIILSRSGDTKAQTYKRLHIQLLVHVFLAVHCPEPLWPHCHI